MDLLIHLVLMLSVFAGGTLGFIYQTADRKYMKLLLSFSGAYLFSLCVIHLIPELYAGRIITDISSNIGIYILAGFFLQIILELFSKGIEHGHIHTDDYESHLIPFTLFISLCVHTFIEGMPLGRESIEPAEAYKLLAGIALHNLPIAFVLMSLFLLLKLSRLSASILLSIFALTAPAGVIAAKLLLFFNDFSDELTAVVIGIFLHISTTILLESSADHRFNFMKIVSVVLAAAIVFLMF